LGGGKGSRHVLDELDNMKRTAGQAERKR